MRKRLAATLLGVVIYWNLPDGCLLHHQLYWEGYVESSGRMGANGEHQLPPQQRTVTFGGTKPYPGCALMWTWPVGVDALGNPICQSVPASVDGVTWQGI